MPKWSGCSDGLGWYMDLGPVRALVYRTQNGWCWGARVPCDPEDAFWQIGYDGTAVPTVDMAMELAVRGMIRSCVGWIDALILMEVDGDA